MSAYREKVPKAVGKQYKAILDKAKPNTALTAALKSGTYKTNIFQMVQNIKDVFARSADLLTDTETDRQTVDAMIEFSSVLEQEVGSGLDDENLKHRVGGEIVLESDDLL